MKFACVAVVLAAVSSPLLLASTALADEDRVRVRGGLAVAGGALMAPEAEVGLGTGGLQGEIGVQINDFVGIAWVPQIDLGFGSGIGGVNLSSAAMAEISPIDFLTLGAGPDVGLFAGMGDGGAAVGLNYGGRFRLAVHPYVVDGRRGRRTALTIAADLRVLEGDTLATGTGGTHGFITQPMVSIGFTAF